MEGSKDMENAAETSEKMKKDDRKSEKDKKLADNNETESAMQETLHGWHLNNPSNVNWFHFFLSLLILLSSGKFLILKIVH